MLRDLVSYGEEPLSDNEDPPTALSKMSLGKKRPLSVPSLHDIPSTSHAQHPELNPPNRTSQVSIRRLAHIKQHPRAPFSDTIAAADGDTDTEPTAESSTTTTMQSTTYDHDDQLTRIRNCLRPPPISGLKDWGIPPEPTGMCDANIEAKLAQFHALKNDPTNPKHFNDSLMANRSFRNPHLYTKLVEFVDVDERVTNFPKDLWNPNDVKEEWFASRIAELQKQRLEQQQQHSQSAGKRSNIQFTASKSQGSGPSTKSRTRGKGYVSESNERHHPYSYGNKEKGTRKH